MSARDDTLIVAQDAEREGRWQLAMEIRATVFENRLADLVERWAMPWSRGEWHGEFVSLDGAAIDDFGESDVDAVLAYGDTGDGWDGESAGIARLRDGRFISWESNWGPTGSGFSADAYGGDADIWFATTAGAALEKISERGRELLKWG